VAYESTHVPRSCESSVRISAVSGGTNQTADHLADPTGGILGIGLVRVQPGDDGVDGKRRCELCRPLRPAAVGNHLGQLTMGEAHGLVVEPVHPVTELGFPGGMVEEKPKPRRIGPCGGKQRVDARVRELPVAYRLDQPITHPIEHCAVEVRLGVEMAVEDDAADPSFGGYIVQAGAREAAMGEGVSSRGEDLLATFFAP